MDKDVKKYADLGDIQRLKYIFVDSLDVDPTFEEYKEDYEYAKKVPGLIEQNQELTPMTKDQSRWNDNYWIALKKDLIENFSAERFEHMQNVAKVIYADKIKRLEAERKKNSEASKEKNPVPSDRFDNTASQSQIMQKPIQHESVQKPIMSQEPVTTNGKEEIDPEENQKKRLAEHKEELAEQYAKDEEKIKKEEENTKKGVGIAVILLAIVLLIIILIKD